MSGNGATEEEMEECEEEDTPSLSKRVVLEAFKIPLNKCEHFFDKYSAPRM